MRKNFFFALAVVLSLTFASCGNKQVADSTLQEPQFVCYYFHRTDTLPADGEYEELRMQIYRDVECPQPVNAAWSKIHDSVWNFAFGRDSNFIPKDEINVLYEYPSVVAKDTESTYSHHLNDYCSVRTIHLDDSIYGLYRMTKYYNTGAHGYEGYYYRYFDTRTGERIFIQDIISDEDALSHYLEFKIHHSSKAWGILADTIRPNNNFIITENGLTFVYNQYEIACFAVDTIMCTVPLCALRSYLTPKWQHYWDIGKEIPKENKHTLFELIEKARYGDTHAFSEWQGRYWEVFCDCGRPDFFEALTTRISVSEFDDIAAIIKSEFGECDEEYISSDNDRKILWWETSAYIITWCLNDIVSGYGHAYLDIQYLYQNK